MDREELRELSENIHAAIELGSFLYKKKGVVRVFMTQGRARISFQEGEFNPAEFKFCPARYFNVTPPVKHSFFVFIQLAGELEGKISVLTMHSEASSVLVDPFTSRARSLQISRAGRTFRLSGRLKTGEPFLLPYTPPKSRTNGT